MLRTASRPIEEEPAHRPVLVRAQHGAGIGLANR